MSADTIPGDILKLTRQYRIEWKRGERGYSPDRVTYYTTTVAGAVFETTKYGLSQPSESHHLKWGCANAQMIFAELEAAHDVRQAAKWAAQARERAESDVALASQIRAMLEDHTK